MEKTTVARRLAQVLWWIGLLLVIAGIGLTLARLSLPAGLALGSGLVVLGLNTLLGGDLVIGPGPRPFTVRGPVVRGHLQASAGLSDLSIGLCGPDRIASLVVGPVGKPGFEMVEGVAQVQLKQPIFPPNITHWRADLAANVLWDIQAASWLGSLELDLGGLRLETINARTTLGRISVTCPTRGYTQMTLRGGVGDIEIIVPDQSGVKVVIQRGPLASITVNNPRLISFRPDRYSTQDYETSGAQIEIRIETFAGDIILG